MRSRSIVSFAISGAITGALGFLVLSLSVGPSASAPATCSIKTFCAGWYTVCMRAVTARGNAPDPAECARRRIACLSSGCFAFSSPGPRCIDNPDHVARTIACQYRR